MVTIGIAERMNMSRGEIQDDGLNSLVTPGDSKGFRQLIPPFRRRSNPEKISSGADTILTFQDKTYVLHNLPGLSESYNREIKKLKKKKPKLKPLTIITSKNYKPDNSKLIRRPTSLSNNDQLRHVYDPMHDPLMVNCLEETILEEEDPMSPKKLKMETTETEQTEEEPEKLLPLQEEIEVFEELEFGGCSGVIGNMISMPTTIYLVNAACDQDLCTVTSLPRLPSTVTSYVDPVAIVVLGAWIVIQILLHFAIPGKIITGSTRPNNKAICYICNGFKALTVTVTLFAFLSFSCPNLVDIILGRIFGLITAAGCFSLLLSIYVYQKSFSAAAGDLSIYGNTGLPVYDFYMGRELNPHVGSLDLKFFCELRPGLLLWGVLDICYVIHQWQKDGQVEMELLAVVLCHWLYIGDALFYEDTVVTTLDITTEGFGFMLAFGDLTWVPFLFSLHARFLSFHPQRHSFTWTALCLVLNCFGYIIFRASNNAKDKFRRSPGNSAFKNSVIVESAQGHTLLACGWWGWLRHPNYFGDFLMALSWSLLCGFGHFLPWFYFIYLCLALLHRTKRDDRKCAQKYGDTWLKYKRMVPYCMIPFMY